MLALDAFGPKTDQKHYQSLQGLLKITPKDPSMPQKSSKYSQGSFKVKTIARGEPLEGQKYTIGRKRMLENHEKPKTL